jgi:dihydrolipoamide dehydrogenase
LRKQAVVDQTSGGVKILMDKIKLRFSKDWVHLLMLHMLLLQKQMELLKLSKENIIIATGSKPSSLPFIKIDKERIITSTEALNLKRYQKTLIIGGGVIGIELGQVYLRLGAQVSVVEYLDRIIPGMDASSKELTKVLKKQGMKFYVSQSEIS